MLNQTSDPNMNIHESKFKVLLNYIKEARGFDLTGYKVSSLMRRVSKRMNAVAIDDFSEYTDFLSVHPDEFSHLFATVLINVTSFFRDKAAWNFIDREIIPKILASKETEEPIRVWCAGVASGQEACSITMLLAEALGDSFFSRVKIYATDLDDEALNEARHAAYPKHLCTNIPQDLLQKYFSLAGDTYSFRTEMRRMVIFGRHDLVQDAPISHIDLLICRNTLMYMNAETQAQIVNRFHFSLNNNGFLFLGKAEMLLAQTDIFQQLEMRHRIFAKITQESNGKQPGLLASMNRIEYLADLVKPVKLREVGLNKWNTPYLIVDKDGNVNLLNEKARQIFGLVEADIGRPLKELEISYRPLELSSLIERALSDHQSINISKVARRLPDGHEHFFDVEITPLVDNANSVLGVGITFTEVSSYYGIQKDLQRSNLELETTNEELQSAQEELETTNEELQSTNEELETMNEELHSTNEELGTTNTELRMLTQELDRSNGFLFSILGTLKSAVIVMDKNFHILVWNSRAEDLWGLRAEEVANKNLFDLDIGLPVKQLRGPLEEAIAKKESCKDLTVQAFNRRGKQISCKVRCLPLASHGSNNESKGLVLSIDEVDNQTK